jgi:hypothetical protein
LRHAEQSQQTELFLPFDSNLQNGNI